MRKVIILFICSLLLMSNAILVYAEATKAPCTSGICPIPSPDATTPDSSASTPETSSTQTDQTSNITGIQLKFEGILESDNWFVIVGLFWVFGLLLSFTPCVLPVIFILTSLLMSQGISVPRNRILKLSLAYVFAMASTYAIAGIISAWLGVHIQIYFQRPWIMATISVFLFLMALSLLDFYKIKLPQSLRSSLVQFNTARASNSYLGAAGMGVVATLMGSPCSAAPLIGVLTFIAQNGNIILGGSALFFMGLGIGTPLVVMSFIGGSILPSIHNWQHGIQAFFGLLLIAVSIMLSSHLLPPIIVMMLWSGLVIVTSINMGALKTTVDEGAWKFWRAMSIMVLVYGIALFFGALIGNKNPLSPLSLNIQAASPYPTSPSFTNIKTSAQLKQALLHAAKHHHPVLLDVYADWCEVCQEVEKNIFQNPKVIKLLTDYTLLRIDLTSLDPEIIALAKSIHVPAPPAMILFDANGVEQPARYNGDVTAEEFVNALTANWDGE